MEIRSPHVIFIHVLKEDRFYEDDDEGDEYENNDDDSMIDRRRRFRRAYEVALETDTQGYQVLASANGASDRSPQELTALSWAAFCTELLPEEDATFRIQALDTVNLFDRLKLASQMLRRKQAQLRVRMERAGLKFRGNEFEGEDDPGRSD
jgi:hypothetical protein